jgi:hypothetical protein
MPQFTFEGPDGQRHTIEGPEGSTPQDAFKHLQSQLSGSQGQTPGLLKSAASGLIQGAGAPGDLSNSVLGNAPAQQPVDKDTYYGKLVDALNVARKHLELPTTPQVGNAVGMQPTSPVTPAEKLVQGGASMVPGAVMGGAGATGRAMMGAGGAANGVRGLGLGPQGPASSVVQGAPGVPGDALQSQLLKAGLQHGASAIGHAVGGPLGGLAAKGLARFAPKVLGFE